MMRSIIRTSIHYRFLVIVTAATIILASINQLRKMPVDILPEFSPPYVEIQTEALGLSAKEIEQMITVPMEQDLLAGVAWLDVIRSQSVPGLSSVLIFFEPGTDLYRARQMVAERIAQSAVGLPHVSKPPTMIQPLSSESRFLIVGLTSEKLSLIDMSVLARWTIAPKLMGVPGVAHVAIWGNRDQQLQVLVDPEELQAQGVSLNQIVETTGNALWVSPLTFLEASSPGTGGFIDTPNQRLSIWHVLPITSPEELAAVPVEGTDGLKLGDVANVVEDHQPLIGDGVVNDTPNVLLVIEKLPGINTLAVTKGVEAALAEMKPGLQGLEFDATLFRPATFLEMAIANLARSLVISALLVTFLLGLLFYGWRAALVSLVGIVVSLFTALFVLYLRGATLNSMVFAGLIVAMGIVLDEAVIDVENILFQSRRNRQEGGIESAENIILKASSEVRGSIFFAVLTTLLVVAPVFFMDGIQGSIFQPLIVSYSLAVIAAMVVAMTVVPALSYILLSGEKFNPREASFVAKLGNGYQRALGRSINSMGFSTMLVAILMIAGVVVVPLIKLDRMLPAFREPYLTIKVEGAPATSRLEMSRIIARMGNEVREIDGVSDVGAHIGRAVFGDQVVGINSSELWVSIDPKADYDVTVAAVQEVVSGYSGLNSEVRTYTQQILNPPQWSNSGEDVTLRIYGEDMNVLTAVAEKLSEDLGGISGVVETRVKSLVEEPTLEIQVDLTSAQKYGIKPGDVRRTAATMLSGILVGNLFEEQKIFDVVVWGVPEIRNSVSDVENLKIQTPSGEQVRLGDVASVKIVPSLSVVRHDAMSSYLDIGFNVKGRSAESVANDIKAKVRSHSFPLEYHAEVISTSAVTTTQQRTLVSWLLAMIGIYLLFQAVTRSWRMALANFILLLAAMSGGLLVAYMMGDTFSQTSLFGLLAVFGIAARNSIMLTGHCQNLEREGRAFGPDLIMRGSNDRFMPTLITALATIVVLLPFAIFGNLPGQEIIHPMSIVMMGGLVSATIINLFVLPAWYLRFGASREPDLGFQKTANADLPTPVAE